MSAPEEIPMHYWDYPNGPAKRRCPECGAPARTPCHNPDPVTGLDTFIPHKARQS